MAANVIWKDFNAPRTCLTKVLNPVPASVTRQWLPVKETSHTSNLPLAVVNAIRVKWLAQHTSHTFLLTNAFANVSI